MTRLMTPDQAASVRDWFNEYAVIRADTPLLDEVGPPVLDHLGNVTYVDDRLSGMCLKVHFSAQPSGTIHGWYYQQDKHDCSC